VSTSIDTGEAEVAETCHSIAGLRRGFRSWEQDENIVVGGQDTYLI